jgi:hypothetical protein
MFAEDAMTRLKRKPSEYCATNCYFGTFLSPVDIDIRHEVGTDRIMWGADFPHHEGTSPHTKRALRHNFAGLPDEEVRQMIAGNAAKCYGFDLNALQAVADRIGPTRLELETPLSAEEIPKYPGETLCPTFVGALDPAMGTRDVRA